MKKQHKKNRSIMQMNLITGLPKKRILLAEDNAILRELGKECLEGCGYLVTMAQNGQEAIDLTEKMNFDLILLDIQMPILNGFQTIEILSKRQNIPAIMALTGFDNLGDPDEYLKAGFVDVLKKPYTINDCKKSISKFL